MVRPDLRGNVEKAYIEEALGYKNALALAGQTDLFVQNGAQYEEQICLVRVGLGSQRIVGNGKVKYPIANFLTSLVPSDFSSLAAKDYVLCGLWTPDMPMAGMVPTFGEVSKFYDPGPHRSFIYLEKDSRKRNGRFQVQRNRPLDHIRGITLGKVFRQYLPCPEMSARLVIAQGEEELEKAKTALVESRGLIPIVMEALKQK